MTSGAEQTIRVLVVDDHRMFAQAIEILMRQADGIEIEGICGTVEDAMTICAEQAPDVVLMDIDLPGISGIEGTRRILAVSPTSKVVAITALRRPEIVLQALEAGACGFVAKTRAAEELVDAIRGAMNGEVVLIADDVRYVVSLIDEDRRRRDERELIFARLTSRETEIIRAFAAGKSTAEVARSLYISPLTVQSHVKNLLAKLGVHSRLEAVALALRYDYIQVNGSANSA